MTQSMTATPQTVATPYGELPVIGVWRQCRHTRGHIAAEREAQRLTRMTSGFIPASSPA